MEITINKTKINVPQRWEELSTEKYIKIIKLLELYKGEDGGLNIDGETLFQKMATIILGLKNKQLLDLDIKVIMVIKKAFYFLNTPMPEVKMVKKIKNKNLIIEFKDFDNITFGEFADLQSMLQNENCDEIKLLSKIVDIKKRTLFKTITYAENEKIEILKKLPCTDYLSISFFLPSLISKYMRNTKRSFHLMAIRMNVGTSFRAIGVIIRSFWHWLMITLKIYKRQPK